MKRIVIMMVVVGIAVALIGCGGDQESSEERASYAEADSTDTVTTASIVNTAEGFIDAAGADGTWIIATTEDLTIDEEILVAGEFTRNDELYRKIALYAQDSERNITDSYTVSAPRLIVQSPNTRIESGTFRGDVFVEAEGFHLRNATVDGDVTFASAALEESFEIDEDSEITGTVEVDG
jgi:hypothetical protein